MGLTVVYALLQSGATLGAALTATYGVAGALAIRLAASVLISAGVAKLSQPAAPKAPQLRRELRLPDSAPVKRFVYGHTSAAGTPVFWHTAGKNLYVCYLFSSRPSEGPFELVTDGRHRSFRGDPYDFAGPGAIWEENSAGQKFYIGLGDQTAPPDDILAAVPELAASDGFRGCTVVWTSCYSGKIKKFQENWPNTPPHYDLWGRWSRVWDPRDPTQDPDDPATWTYSDNHALCVLDALRQNPVRPYQLRNLDLDLWSAAAEASDEGVELAIGATEKRYRLAGTLAFSGREVLDLLDPMLLAAAAEWCQIGGRLGLVPAVWQTPDYQISDMLEELSCQTLTPGDDLPTRVEVSYTSAAREYQQAQLAPWDIPGAQAADGGERKLLKLDLDWAASPQQAMRVRKIMGLRARCQKVISGTAPPDALDLMAGANASVTFPAPLTGRNGTYKVESIHPAFDMVGQSGLALRCPITLREHYAGIYAWDAATEEEALDDPAYEVPEPDYPGPRDLTYATGPEFDLVTGWSRIERIFLSFDPGEASEHYLEYRVEPDGPWMAAGVITEDMREAGGRAYAFIAPANPLARYTVRLTARYMFGESEPLLLTGVTIGAGLPAVSGSAGLGAASFTGTAPGLSSLAGLRVYRADPGAGFAAAVPVSEVIAVTPGGAFEIVAGSDGAVDLIENGEFEDGSAWTFGEGWQQEPGAVRHLPGSADSLTQPVTLSEGSSFRLALTITGRSAGQVTPQLSGGEIQSGAPITSNGRSLQTLTATSGNDTLSLTASPDFDGVLTRVTLFVQTVSALPQGEGAFFVVPVLQSGDAAPPSNPIPLTIP
ncbi:phage tail protein [Salipiger marinus]|uniref:Putative phage tail protein n=1 Tax=Salipiger marinus TaxID=555512 RepID=A0A1G8RWK3_9RHOB|nr:phage tail protein [Salipiger marinus]SDJ21333.1 Putative phage tail protein [Salipiger marinus]